MIYRHTFVISRKRKRGKRKKLYRVLSEKPDHVLVCDSSLAVHASFGHILVLSDKPDHVLVCDSSLAEHASFGHILSSREKQMETYL